MTESAENIYILGILAMSPSRPSRLNTLTADFAYNADNTKNIVDMTAFVFEGIGDGKKTFFIQFKKLRSSICVTKEFGA